MGKLGSKTLKICFVIMIFIIMAFSVTTAMAMEGDDAKTIIAQIQSTYKTARSRRGYSFDGACGSYVNYQMLILGINTSYVRGNGNEEYGNYCNKTKSSGGYTITAYAASKNERSLKTVLNKITENGTKDAYNILVGFTRGSASSAGQTYGHTFFIHAIIDGICYYSESFSSSSYGKEGAPTALTINQIANRYPDNGTTYHLDGVIHFQKSYAERCSGIDRYETALNSMKEFMKLKGLSKVDSIVVANGINFPDALSGSYLSATFSAPILLVSNVENLIGYYPGQNTLILAIKNYLNKNGKIYVLGGNSAVPEKLVQTVIDETGVEVIRLSGSNRYETSMNILNAAGSLSGKELLICSGTNFADALSASALGRPVLLVYSKAKTLTTAQEDFIKNSGFSKIYIIGGTSAVTNDLSTAIEKAFGKAPKRISGSTRYETSINIAKEFFESVKQVVITNGKNFPDGLTGGLLSYAKKTPMLLVEDTSSAKKTIRSYIQSKSINSFYILGGNSAVPYAILEGIRQ